MSRYLIWSFTRWRAFRRNPFKVSAEEIAAVGRAFNASAKLMTGDCDDTV